MNTPVVRPHAFRSEPTFARCGPGTASGWHAAHAQLHASTGARHRIELKLPRLSIRSGDHVQPKSVLWRWTLQPLWQRVVPRTPPFQYHRIRRLRCESYTSALHWETLLLGITITPPLGQNVAP
jgi:hypothetical protein